MNRIKVKVLYLGPARDASGSREEILQLPNPSFLKDVLGQVMKNHENLVRMKDTMKVAVNTEVVDTNVELYNGDEIALLPPVAGG